MRHPATKGRPGSSIKGRTSLIVLLPLVLTMLLAACGDATSTPAAPTKAATAATTTAPATTAAAAATTAAPTTAAPAATTAAPATTAAAVTAAATSAASAFTGQATIRVMTFFAYDNPEVEKGVVEAFQKANPNIKVNLEQVSYDDIFTKYKTQVAGGTAPDVISMNFENVRSYATKKALAPLNDLVSRDKFNMGIYYPNTVQMHTVDNNLYGLPATFSDNVVYYNKTMFDKAGVTYPDATWDWSKLVSTAKQFTNGETYGYGPAWWPMYLFLYNTNILTADNAKCALDTPEGLQAIQAYVDLSTKDKVSANAAAAKAQGDYDRFIAGKLAMYVAGPWAVKPFNKAIKDTFQWDIAEHPKGTTQGTFLYSNTYAISASSKNKDASWEFLKFASGVEGQTIRQKGQFEITTIKSVADSTFVPSMKGQSPAHPEIFLNATAYGKKLPDHARLQEILDAIQPELDLALNGNKSVKETMAAACNSVNSILAQK